MNKLIPLKSEGKESVVRHEGVLRRFDIILFLLSAILALDVFAPTAALGPASLSWWVIALVFFFVPYTLIIIELTTTYPEQGGLFVWINRAFGGKWAARTTWLYWVNVALWMPSVYLLFAEVLSQLFYLDLGPWARVGIGLVMSWVTVGLVLVPLKFGKWVFNIGALLKIVLTIVIIILGVVYATKSGIPNDLSWRQLLPRWQVGINFLPIIAYNFMGLELLAGATREVKNPRSDIPPSFLIAGASIAIIYVLGTLSFLMIFKVQDLEAIKGVMDAFWVVFGETGIGGVLVVIFGLMSLFTIMAGMVCWVMGVNRTIARAAQERELPSVFGTIHPTHQTPLGATIIIGFVTTLVLLIYGLLAGSKEALFRLLFAFNSMIYLLPYLAIFPAFLKLRKDAGMERPFQIRLGSTLLFLMVVICELFILQAIVLYIWRPGVAFEWSFAGPALLGVVLVLIAGEIMLEIASLQQKRSVSEN